MYACGAIGDTSIELSLLKVCSSLDETVAQIMVLLSHIINTRDPVNNFFDVSKSAIRMGRVSNLILTDIKELLALSL